MQTQTSSRQSLQNGKQNNLKISSSSNIFKCLSFVTSLNFKMDPTISKSSESCEVNLVNIPQFVVCECGLKYEDISKLDNHIRKSKNICSNANRDYLPLFYKPISGLKYRYFKDTARNSIF